MNKINIGLTENDRYVLKMLLPHLVEDINQEFEHQTYSGHHTHAANMMHLFEHTDSSNPRIWKPIAATGRAVSIGAGLAATDGPLPVMDVIGFGISVTMTAIAWHEYFTG